jgi:hypothetical protein
MKTKSVSQLVEELKLSPEMRQKLHDNPLQFLENVQDEKPINNKVVFLVVISIVGLVLLASVVMGSMIIFNSDDNQTAKVPEFLVSIGATALGALVGLLAPAPN